MPKSRLKGTADVNDRVRVLGHGATEALVLEMDKILDRHPPSPAYDELVSRLKGESVTAKKTSSATASEKRGRSRTKPSG